MEDEDCRNPDCKILNILDEVEEKHLRGFFSSREIKIQSPIAKIKSPCSVQPKCPHMYSWAFDYFCDNKEAIEKYLENNKE